MPVCLRHRFGVLRGVGQGQHQRDADLRAPRRPHLRQDVQESGRQHDGAQQSADEAFDGSTGRRGRRRRPCSGTIRSPAAMPTMLVTSELAPAAAAAAAAAGQSRSVGPLHSQFVFSVNRPTARG